MPTSSCVVCGASNINLFKFPSNEPYRTEWKKFANLTDINNVTYYKLCMRHFSEDVINSSPQSEHGKPKAKRIRLHKTAIPTLNRECNVKCNVQKYRKTHVCLICKKRSDGIHFKFPSNLQKRNEWLRLSGYAPDFFNGEKEWFLCSVHFPECDISRKRSLNGRTCLRGDAKPTLFLPKLYISSLVNESGRNCSIENVPITSDVQPSNLVIQLSDKFKSDNTSVTLDLHSPPLPVELPSNDNENISPTDIIDAIKTHKDCPTCITFLKHLPTNSTTKYTEVSSIQTTPTMSHSAVKRRRIRYAGDIKRPDFATPNSARRSVNFLKNEVTKYRWKIDILNKRNRRLQKVVKTYKEVVELMKSKGWLSEND